MTNPFDLVKTRKQIAIVDQASQNQSIAVMLKNEGVSSLSKGMGMRLAYNVPACMIAFTVFEVMYHWFDNDALYQ